MQIQHLQIFVKLAENLSFTQTAMRMNISQSACSQIINSIESETGLTLFIRTNRSVRLTTEGKAFYEKIKPIINSYYKSITDAKAVEARGEKSLTIGYSGTPFEEANIPSIIRKFKREYPNINVFLEIHGHDGLKSRLSSNDIDVIWTMKDIINGQKNVKFTLLNKGYYVIAVPKGYPITLKKKYRYEDLNYSKIIFTDTQWLPPISINVQDDIRNVNPQLKVIYGNTAASECDMVRAGIALGLWTNFVHDSNDTSMTAVPLDNNVFPEYGLATLEKGCNDAAKIFVDWVKKQKIKF